MNVKRNILMTIAVVLSISVLAVTLFFGFKKEEPLTGEQKIEKEFMKYVEKEFPNPDEFIEIVSIVKSDSLDNHFFDDLHHRINNEPLLKWQFGKVRKFNRQYEEYSKREFKWILYDVRFKKRVDGQVRTFLYQAIDDGVDVRFQKHTLRIDDVPAPFPSLLYLAEDIMLI